MRFCTGILFLLGCHCLFAQSASRQTNMYTVKEGLSNNMVLCITQDSRGFIWAGTQEGLNRFDGFAFKKYFAKKNDTQSLPSDNILAIVEYKYGQLLIATANGLGVLNTLTGQFENQKIKPVFLRAGSGTVINSLYKDPQSRIWINHSGELDLLDSNLTYLRRFTDLSWAAGLKGILISLEQWYTDKQGRIWLPSNTSGIHIIDPAAEKVYNYKNNPQHLPYLKSESVRSFILDEENNTLLYAPWGEGLICCNLLTQHINQELFDIPLRDESRTINSIIKTGPGKFLFYIGAVCYEMDVPALSYKKIPARSIQYTHDIRAINSIVLLQSKYKQCWVGTTVGLVMDDPERSSYTTLPLPFTSDCTDMIVGGSGEVYCLYDKHIAIISKDRKQVSTHLLSLPDRATLTEICEDRLGHTWIGTSVGIYQFDTATKKIFRPNTLPPALHDIRCNVLYCDSDGDMWIATRDPFMLYRYDPARNQIQRTDNAITRKFERPGEGNRISTIQEDKQGRLWMTSRLGGGIVCYTKKNNEWKLFPGHEAGSGMYAKKGIACMYADNTGSLWLSNYSGDGLIRFDIEKNEFKIFDRSDGLQSNYLRKIFGDRSGNIWLTSEYGITGFRATDMQQQSTIASSDLGGDDQESVFDAFNNTLVFSSRNKLLLLTVPEKAKKSAVPVPVVDRIVVNNKEQFIDPTFQTMHLGHEQNNITFDFTSVGFSNSSNTRFAYQLSGADKEWKYTETNRTAQYSVLPPGSYTFTVKTTDETGQWSPVPASFSFTIAQPWCQTLWFRLLVLATVAGLVFYFVRRRIQTIRREGELKHRIAETEMQALRAQMNPHFIFNCINSIDAMIQSNDKYHATVYLNKFARLIRNILDSSKQNLVPLSKDIETLKLYIELEQFRNENKFTSEIKIEDSILQEDYKIPPLIIQPYVENAILHGLRKRTDHNGHLDIRISKENGHLKYIVNDNGAGRMHATATQSQEKRSYGMEMSNDRVKLFNQEEEASVIITDLVTEGKPAGTQVEVLLKIN